jgi:hypothetical protein
MTHFQCNVLYFVRLVQIMSKQLKVAISTRAWRSRSKSTKAWAWASFCRLIYLFCVVTIPQLNETYDLWLRHLSKNISCYIFYISKSLLLQDFNTISLHLLKTNLYMLDLCVFLCRYIGFHHLTKSKISADMLIFIVSWSSKHNISYGHSGHLDIIIYWNHHFWHSSIIGLSL